MDLSSVSLALLGNKNISEKEKQTDCWYRFCLLTSYLRKPSFPKSDKSNWPKLCKIGRKSPKSDQSVRNERTASKIVRKCPKSDGSVPLFFVYSFPRGKTGFMYMNVVRILGIVHVLHRLQKSNSSYRCVVETSLILLTGLHTTVLRYYHSTLNYSL